MTIPELKNRIILIQRFILKMDRENIPVDNQKILIKSYAHTLRINLTDKMVDNMICVCLNINSVSKFYNVYKN